MAKYRQVKAPPDYPGKVYSWGSRILEHHLVWWKNTGQIVPDGHEIHHKNHDGKDNRFDNLTLLPSIQHRKIHATETFNGYIDLQCDACGVGYQRTVRYVRSKQRAGIKQWYCSKRCSATSTSGFRARPLQVQHGSKSAYNYHRCRCEICVDSNRQRSRAYMKVYKGRRKRGERSW